MLIDFLIETSLIALYVTKKNPNDSTTPSVTPWDGSKSKLKLVDDKSMR